MPVQQDRREGEMKNINIENESIVNIFNESGFNIMISKSADGFIVYGQVTKNGGSRKAFISVKPVSGDQVIIEESK